MKTTLHPAETRGHAMHGWLDTWHTFSFARYYDPERVHFGALRVLNDDTVLGGTGFGTHPHDNMEIITIPLAGSLRHADSMGHEGIIRAGEVQVMTAGTGLTHSEHNASPTEPLSLLQIWIFPRQRGLIPRYDQREFPAGDRAGRWQTVVSPDGAEGLMINQDAWLHLADLAGGSTITYEARRSGNGVYLFVIEGGVRANGIALGRRDGLGVEDPHVLALEADGDARVLLIDVPMDLTA